LKKDPGEGKLCGMRAMAAGLFALVVFASAGPVAADDAPPADDGVLDAYFRMVERSQAGQPHWISPLITTTPRLNERFRYDTTWQARARDVTLTNYGSGKGVELILAAPVALTLGVPGYVVRDSGSVSRGGWADETFLLKYRFVGADEASGNYVVSAFLGVSVPTGSDALTAGKVVWTPTLAWGKGWGTRDAGFDIQSTLAVSVPAGDKGRIGVPVVWNTAFQGHVLSDKLWPEFEMSLTHWTDGPNDGKWQAIATAGIVFGRFPISGRIHFDLGAGYQFAVSEFRTYDSGWIATVRMPF